MGVLNYSMPFEDGAMAASKRKGAESGRIPRRQGGCDLEDDAAAQLNLPGVGVGCSSGDVSETAGSGAGDVGRRKDGVVEGVEYFEAQLQVHAFGEVEILEERSIEIVEAVLPDPGEGLGQSAVVEGVLPVEEAAAVAGSRRGAGGGIAGDKCGPVESRSGRSDGRGVARMVGDLPHGGTGLQRDVRSQLERRTGLELVDAVQDPAAGNLVPELAAAEAPRLILAEGQIVSAADREVVDVIEEIGRAHV